MSTEQSIPLFNEEETKAQVIDVETEELIAHLISIGFIGLKKQEIIEAINFFSSVNNPDFLRTIEKVFKDKERTMEFPQVYEPIIQIEAFEKSRIPLFYKEDGEIEIVISKVLMYFFPGCEIKKDESSYFLHLNSVPFRRFSYFANLVKENSTWISFISENFKEEFDINRRAQKSLESLFGMESNRTGLLTTKKNPIVFDEHYFNFDEIVIALPYKSSIYMDKFERTRGAQTSSFFLILDTLVEFSQSMHFISDSYREINSAVNKEFEKETQAYTEKQQSAVVDFEKELARHIVPISRLNHKSAQAYAKANGITEVLLPIKNMERFTTDSSIGLSVYVREDAKKNQDWLIVPPTKEVLSLDGMEYQGVLNYTNYETTSYLATKQKSPHVVGTDSQLSTMIDESLFMDILEAHYQESPSYPAIRASLELLRAFPKAFSKLVESEDSFHSEEEKVATKSRKKDEVDFSSWISNTPDTFESSPQETGSLANALEMLNTHVAGEESATGLIEVGSLLVPEDYPESSLFTESLLEVQEIDLVECEGNHSVVLKLKVLATRRSSIETEFIRVDLSETNMVFANEPTLDHYFSMEGVALAHRLTRQQLKEKFIGYAMKMNLAFNPQTEDEPLEQEIVEIEEIEDSHPFDDTMPTSLDNITSELIYTFDVNSNKLIVYKNKVEIYTKQLIGTITTSKIKFEVSIYTQDHPAEDTGIGMERPFMLPIYDRTTGRVLTGMLID